MTHSMIQKYFCLACLSALFMMACQNPTPPQSHVQSATPQAEAKPAILLRTYEVPAGQTDRLKGVLARVLQKEGNVERLPGDVLIVAAPAHIHEGIAALIKDGPGLEASARQSITLDVWLVAGTFDAAMMPDASTSDKRLDGLSKELDVIRQSDGFEHFTLLDHVQLVTLDGERGQAESQIIEELAQTASVQGDRVEARVMLKATFTEGGRPRGLDTVLRLERDESIVLGQAGYEVDGVKGSVFYVVRASVQP